MTSLKQIIEERRNNIKNPPIPSPYMIVITNLYTLEEVNNILSDKIGNPGYFDTDNRIYIDGQELLDKRRMKE